MRDGGAESVAAERSPTSSRRPRSAAAVETPRRRPYRRFLATTWRMGNKITVEKLKLTNYNRKNSGMHGGFRTGSAIIVTGEDVLLSGNGKPNVLAPGGSFKTKRLTYK